MLTLVGHSNILQGYGKREKAKRHKREESNSLKREKSVIALKLRNHNSEKSNGQKRKE